MDPVQSPDLIGTALRERLGEFSRGTSLSERMRAREASESRLVIEMDAVTVEVDEELL